MMLVDCFLDKSHDMGRQDEYLNLGLFELSSIDTPRGSNPARLVGFAAHLRNTSYEQSLNIQYHSVG
jgi:hypothetical protein